VGQLLLDIRLGVEDLAGRRARRRHRQGCDAILRAQMEILTDRQIDVRAAEPSDRPAVFERLSASLGGSPDERFDALLSWTHEDEPIGRPPAWVAVDGQAVVGFRMFIRREAPTVECVLCDVLSPAGDRGVHRALVRSVVGQSGADHVIRLGGSSVGRGGFVRVPGQGAILTWRLLASATHGGRLGDCALPLGDIELF